MALIKETFLYIKCTKKSSILLHLDLGRVVESPSKFTTPGPIYYGPLTMDKYIDCSSYGGFEAEHKAQVQPGKTRMSDLRVAPSKSM